MAFSLKRWHPGVSSVVVNRLRRRRKLWVAEAADSHRNGVRFALRLPKHGRCANWTELKVHCEAAVALAPVAPKVAFRLNGVAREEGGNAKRAACAPLAL